MIDLINKYSHDHLACVQYFFNIKWPTGFYCDKCGCTHYYFNEKRTLFECADCGSCGCIDLILGIKIRGRRGLRRTNADFLGADYADYTDLFLYCNERIRVIRVIRA